MIAAKIAARAYPAIGHVDLEAQCARLPEKLPALPHRSDIDGLRALAVAAVILYHADVPGFSGGFVGVDVFFVISGYLITQLLTRPAALTRGALAQFYLARARRILPALLTMCVACSAAAWALLLPWDLPAFGQYLAATTLMLSNVPSWLAGANYFDNSSTYLALTHLWSIAVEEQFYFLYPLCLLLLSNLPQKRRLTVLLLLGAASFALCVIGSHRVPQANYFLSPSRAWELLMGGALTLLPALNLTPRRHSLLGIAGIAGLGAAVALYTPVLRYPGSYTLLPCAATAALILSGRVPNGCSRILAVRPLVFTGLISYSLYLWHLPVLMFAAYYRLTPVPPALLAALLLAIYVLSAVTYACVENPLRRRRALKSSARFLAAIGLVNATLLAFGVLLWRSDGFPGRFGVHLTPPDQNWMALAKHGGRCLNQPPEVVARAGLCSYGPQDDAAPRALVWGDSHAMALLPAYERAARSHGVRIYFALKAACRPELHVANRRDDTQHRADCARFNAAVLAALPLLHPDLIILNAHWVDTRADLSFDDPSLRAAGPASVESGISALLSRAPPGTRTCVVLDVPSFPVSLPHAVSMAQIRGVDPASLTVRRADAAAEFDEVEDDFRRLEARGAVSLVDPKALLCAGGTCRYEAQGSLLYSDKHHLSRFGAIFVQPEIERCLDSGSHVREAGQAPSFPAADPIR